MVSAGLGTSDRRNPVPKGSSWEVARKASQVLYKECVMPSRIFNEVMEYVVAK